MDVELVLVCPPDARGAISRIAPNYRVITDEGRGLYGALNTALRAVSGGDVATWLNDDDVLRMPGGREALRLMEREVKCDVVYGRVKLMDTRGNSIGEIPVARCCEDIPYLFARQIVPLAQPGTWFRMRLFDRLGGLDESFRLAGDLDFFSRAMASGARFEFLPAVVAGFRLRKGQLSKDEVIGEKEMERALRPWADTAGSASASFRFHRDNLGVYLERIRRHGFVSMRKLYRQE